MILIPRRNQEFMCAWAKANGLDPGEVIAAGLKVRGGQIIFNKIGMVGERWVRTDHCTAPLVVSMSDFEKTWRK